MIRHATISICALLLVSLACAAQSDSTEHDAKISKSDYPLSFGMIWGVAVPLANRGTTPDDPLYIMDSSGNYGSFVGTVAWRVTDRLTVEGVVDNMIIQGQTILEEYSSRNYPDDIILNHSMTPFSTTAAVLGLSYRIPLIDALAFEPGLLAGNINVRSVEWSVLLKKPQSNEYRRLDRNISGGNAFTLIPTLMFRATFNKGESRWGLQLRGAYVYGRMNMVHSSTEHTLTEEPRTETSRRHHRLDCINVGLGFYYRAL